MKPSDDLFQNWFLYDPKFGPFWDITFYNVLVQIFYDDLNLSQHNLTDSRSKCEQYWLQKGISFYPKFWNKTTMVWYGSKAIIS